MNLENRFDDFLDGTMNKTDHDSFMAKIKADPIFKENFETHRAKRVAVESYFLKEEMFGSQKTPVKEKTNAIWKYVLAFLLISILGFLVYSQLKNSPQHQDLHYAEQYTIHPGLPVTMSSQENADFIDGMIDYKNKDMANAISKWQELEVSSPGNDTLNFFMANALMQNKKYAESIPYLRKVVTQESEWKERAEWMLALVLSENGNTAFLIQISLNDKHSYQSQARQALSRGK